MKKILIHTCCANCLIYPLEILKKENFEVHAFFYNHIHPFTEFSKRLKAVIDYTKKEGINCIVREEYKLIEFLENTVFREENRCFYCYSSRIEATARLASKSGFEYFTTTLLYSKHQKHNYIIEISENMAKRYSIKFFYRDFREGWQKGIEKSKELGLYRQQYCGCIYSEKERYLGKNNRFKTVKIKI